MRYACQRIIENDLMSDDLIEQIVKHQEWELIGHIVGKMELDRPYSVVMRRDIGPLFGDPMISEGRSECRMSIEIEPIPTQTLKLITPEEIFFRDTKSLRTKLKNCWLYLRDKTGGHYE